MSNEQYIEKIIYMLERMQESNSTERIKQAYAFIQKLFLRETGQ